MADVNTNHLLEPGSAQGLALEAAQAEIRRLGFVIARLKIEIVGLNNTVAMLSKKTKP